MADQAPHTKRLPRVLRGIAMTGVVGASMVAATVIVLWDADIYTARDKFEHFKLALFGDWQADSWCPPGRVSANCAAVDGFEAALEEASDFTFFRSVPIKDTDLTVQTGIRFATARDVISGKVASQWCYVSIPAGGFSQQIELATQSADEPPIYAKLASLDASAVAGSGLGIDALMRLARSHCRFD